MLHEVKVPLINANEDELTLVSLRASVGDEVKEGEIIAVVESTKATMDVEAPSAGFIRRLPLAEDSRVAVGALLCLMSDTADEVLPEIKKSAEGDGVKATAKAKRLAEEHGIDLASLGVSGIVKERDVQKAIGQVSVAKRINRDPLSSNAARKMVVLGAGGHAKVILDVIAEGHRDVAVVAIVDDGKAPPADVFGVPVVGESSRFAELLKNGISYAGLGVGAVTNNRLRVTLFNKLIDAGFEVPNLIHARANVEPSVTMGRGNQIFAGSTIGSDAVLGDNTIINSGVVVSHECKIGSHVHLTPGAILAGSVTVGENTVIGMGVTVYLGITIGKNVVIANGVHVMQDVPDGTILQNQSMSKVP